VERAEEIWRANVLGTANAVTAAERAERFVHFSSVTVFRLDFPDGVDDGINAHSARYLLRSGTYSNADFSTTPDGGFIIQLPGPDTYVEYLHPATLPADASPIIPATGTYSYTFTVGVISNFEGNFLISSTNCVNSTNPPPPPPPPATNKCCMTGGGTIVKGKGQPAYTFSLEVFPGDTSSGVDNGKLDIVAHAMRLHLKGDVFEIVNCGGEGSCQFVEFQGAGTLTGIAGNKANYGVVYFYARAEDCGEGKNKNEELQP
jgi:hypothetical protein